MQADKHLVVRVIYDVSGYTVKFAFFYGQGQRQAVFEHYLIHKVKIFSAFHKIEKTVLNTSFYFFFVRCRRIVPLDKVAAVELEHLETDI